MYGKELIIDLYGCNSKQFNRKMIKWWLDNLCDEDMLNMNQEDLHWWDFADASEEDIANAPDHLLGTSVIQFITTSNITVHTIDRLGEMYINIFSCKDFDVHKAIKFTVGVFCAKSYETKVLERGRRSKCEMEVTK